MRLGTLIGIVVLSVVARAPAQPVDTFAAVTPNTLITGPSRIHQFDANGKIVGILATFPTWFSALSVGMSEDNRSLRVLGTVRTGNPAQNGGAIFDVSLLGQTTTLLVSTSLLYPNRMVLNDDGEWVILDSNSTFLLLRGTSLTLLGASNPGTVTGIRKDLMHDAVLVRSSIFSPTPTNVFARVSYRTGQVTTLHNAGRNVFYVNVGGKSLPYEAATGALLDASGWPQGGLRFWRVYPGVGTVPFPTVNVNALPRDLLWPSQRHTGFHFYMFGQVPPTHVSLAVYRVSTSGQVVSSAVVQHPIPAYGSPFVRVGSRNLRWSLDYPPNGRSLHLSFPNEGGRDYVVGMSLTGIAPGFTLPDGRVIPLVHDALTNACMSGGIAGVIQGTKGSLDTFGRARVAIDGNPFGKAIRGLRLWASAVVLDPKSSSGVAWIAGPELLVFK